MNKAGKQFSGVYPHLAVTNDGSTECGIGAVVSYGGRLYWITYAASGAHGDDNGLFSIDAQGERVRHPESVGGTHANRLYHAPSGQLIMGACLIDEAGGVRALDLRALAGRLTGSGTHLHTKDEWIYINTMEDGLYEVDVRTLAFRRLRRDRFEDLKNPALQLNTSQDKLPGDHGKGGYTGQGVFVLTNNGHGGVLAEWDGRGDAQRIESWRIVDREKYTEVTGPGGIFGEQSAGDPIWALGWDHRSVLLNVRTGDGRWTRYRLPKASYTQDADHGWYTEWPRIRQVAQGRYLMCMHGMLYRFPAQFQPTQTEGLLPIARHLKMIADYDAWQDGIAFACDDASVMDSPLTGQQQSNLWFARWEELERMSAPGGWGGPYVHDAVQVGVPSEPFFVGGFETVLLHIAHGDDHPVGFVIEADVDNTGTWQAFAEMQVSGHGYAWRMLSVPPGAAWVRLRANRDVTDCSAYFHLDMARDTPRDASLVERLQAMGAEGSCTEGQLYTLPGKDMRLQFVPQGRKDGAYGIDGDLHSEWREEKLPHPGWDAAASFDPAVRILPHSVRLTDRDGNVFHLPKLSGAYDAYTPCRLIREVVTERSMLNVCGTFYELPRFDAGGVRRMKPVTSHGLRIMDFCSWRGILILTGVQKGAEGERLIPLGDGNALWAGTVDDLWRMGAPQGEGAPAFDTPLLAGEASEPILMAGFRHKAVQLSHSAGEAVEMSVEVDFLADGHWHSYATWTVAPSETHVHTFPEGYDAHWARVRVASDCRVTARFDYRQEG